MDDCVGKSPKEFVTRFSTEVDNMIEMASKVKPEDTPSAKTKKD